MNYFQQFLLLGLFLAFGTVFWMLMAVLAWRRAEEVRKALMEADARIRALEAAVASGAPAMIAHLVPQDAVREALQAPQKQTVPPHFTPEFEALPRPAAPAPASAPFTAPARPRLEPPPPLTDTGLPLPGQKQGLSWGWIALGVGVGVAIFALLRAADAQGVFGAVSQALMGFLIAAGLSGASEYLWRQPEENTIKQVQNRSSATMLASAGLFALFASPVVTALALRLIDPPAALGLMGVATVVGLALALRHGWTMAAASLLGGFAAPAILAPGEAALPAGPFFAFLFTISAAALALAKHRAWAGLAWASGALAAFWSVWWASNALAPAAVPASAFYALGLAALGAALAWDDAERAINLELPWAPRPSWSGVAWAGQTLIVAAGLVLVLLFVRAGPVALPAAMGAVILTAVLAGLASLRQGYCLAALASAACAILILSLWSINNDGQQARWFATVGGGLGFAATLGGLAMMARNTASGPGAILAALAPAAVLYLAHAKIGGVNLAPAWAWAGAAAGLGAINAFATERIASKAGGPQNAPGASGAFAIGAVACALMAVSFGLDDFLMVAVAAVIVVPLAYIDQRIDYPPLRYAAAAIAAFVTAVLAGPAPLYFKVSPAPLMNELSLGYGVAIAAFFVACRLFAGGPAGYLGRITSGMRLGLLVLMVAFVIYQVRHLVNGGQMLAPYSSLLELGGHVSVLALVALGLTLRYTPPLRTLVFSVEALLFGAAVALAAMGGLTWLNPWWGTQPAAVADGLLANHLAVGYALPAALFAAYARVQSQHAARERVTIAAAMAISLGVTWVLLEVRRAFHGATLANVSTSSAEHVALSLTLAACAAAILAIGFWRNAASLKWVSAALAAATCAKMLFVDAFAIDGWVRYAAIAAATAMACVVFLAYQRYVFADARSGAAAEQNPGAAPTVLP